MKSNVDKKWLSINLKALSEKASMFIGIVVLSTALNAQNTIHYPVEQTKTLSNGIKATFTGYFLGSPAGFSLQKNKPKEIKAIKTLPIKPLEDKPPQLPELKTKEEKNNLEIIA